VAIGLVCARELVDHRTMLRTLALAAMLLASSIARADEAEPVHAAPAQPKPWTVGVTQDQKTTAKQHLDAGNGLFVQRKYSEALVQYRQALAAWNHPAIRFNMVRCLVFLEKPLDAYEELEKALQYGAGPFEEAIYSDVLGYQKLLQSQIGTLEISCDQPGVELRLDGDPLPACPGTFVRRVRPSSHQIVGKKTGFVTRTIEIDVYGGKSGSAKMTLDPLSKAARIEHRWKTWKPPAVIIGGVVLAGIGGIFRIAATGDNKDYGKVVLDQCPVTACPENSVNSKLTTAQIENGFAIGLASLGGATIITGSVMLYLNRGRTVYETGEKPRLNVAPAPGGGVVSLDGRF
jgi:hypothetical protein